MRTDRTVQRRQLLLGALGGAASLTMLRHAAAAPAAAVSSLSFYHIHTSEKLTVTYRENGALVPDAVAAINHFLRDHRNGNVRAIDVELLDRLSTLYRQFDGRGKFEVISGYRSAASNEALRNVTTGVAKRSLHIDGRAIDVRLTSAATAKLRDAALALQRGGIGYYPESNFVHLDTGAFRAW